MAIQTEPVVTEITAVVDEKSFRDGVKFARDTGKEIDQNLKKRLELDIAQAQINLKGIREQLKQATTEEQKVRLQIDANELQRGLTESKRQLNNLVNTGDPALSRLQAKFNSVNDGIKGIGGTLGKITNTIGEVGSSLGLAFGVGAIIQATQSVFGLVSAYQKYESVLTNSLGSAEEARKSLELIREVAKTTPFEVNQLTESYIKLVNRGFKPTRAEIISLGDLASSQGKQFDQLVEALLDAQTGEFERLKEFGVRARVSGDQVAFTFKGITTTVQKTDEAIKSYVLGLGNLQGVSGGMAAQSQTLGGQFSNLLDQLTQLGTQIGQILVPVFQLFIAGASNLIGFVSLLTSNVPLLSTAFVGLGTALLLVNFGGITGAIGAFIGFVPALITGITTLTTGFTGLGVASSLALGPIGILISLFAALATAYSTNLFGVQELINGYLGLGLSQQQVAERSAELTKQLDDNNQKLTQLSQTAGNATQILDILNDSQTKLSQAVAEGTITNEDAEAQFKKNIEQVAILQQALDAGKISQQDFDLATQTINESQSILEQLLGRVESATIANTSANDAYNNAKIDTTVSQQELEALRQKAIQTTKAVLAALQLQLKGQQDFNNAQKSFTVPGFGGTAGFAEQAGNAAISETQKEIDSLTNSLKDLEAQSTKTIVGSRGKTGGSSASGTKKTGGGSGKSEAQKRLDEETKVAEQQKKLAEDTAKKVAEANAKATKTYGDTATKVLDQFDKVIEATSKKLDELDSKIKDKTGQIGDINTQIAQRAVALQNELLAIQSNIGTTEDPTEKLKLQEDLAKKQAELELARQSVSAEQIATELAQSKLSDTEKLLQKRTALEAELIALEEQKSKENQILATARDQQLQAEKAFTSALGLEIQKRGQFLDSYIQKLQSASSISGSLGSVTAQTSQARLSNAVNNTVTNNFNVSDPTSAESVARSLNSQLL